MEIKRRRRVVIAHLVRVTGRHQSQSQRYLIVNRALLIYKRPSDCLQL